MIRLKEGYLTGSYPPLVTPFKGGAVDYETYARLVERQVAEGSHGIVVNGTTSEPSTLSVEERDRLVETAVRAAAGRIPVVAATGGQSHADTIAMTAAAEKSGADAILVVTPYFVRPPQRGLVEYYLDIGGRTALRARAQGSARRGARGAFCAVRAQSSRVLRYEPDTHEIHDEAPGAHAQRGAPAPHGARDARARQAPRPGVGARGRAWNRDGA